MAPNPNRQRLREVNQRIKFHREEISRHRDDVELLKAEQERLRELLASEETHSSQGA